MSAGPSPSRFQGFGFSYLKGYASHIAKQKAEMRGNGAVMSRNYFLNCDSQCRIAIQTLRLKKPFEAFI